MAQFLKIQEEAKVSGVTIAPSYLLPLNPLQAQKAKEFIATLDLVDNDGGAIDGDVDLTGKFVIGKVPIVGKLEGTQHLTLSVVER